MSAPLDDSVTREIARHFAASDVAEATRIVEATDLGTMREPNSRAGRLRIQHAMLRLAKGDLTRLRESATHAARDWRNVLVWSGLGAGDWVKTLRDDGVEVDARA